MLPYLRLGQPLLSGPLEVPGVMSQFGKVIRNPLPNCGTPPSVVADGHLSLMMGRGAQRKLSRQWLSKT